MTNASPPIKVYKPSAGGGTAYAIAVLIGLGVGFLDRGTWIFFSVSGLIGTGLGLLVAAYISFFGTRWWVCLYDKHLEIHPRLAKLIQDRLGVSLYTPRAISYQQIREVKWTRGFGWFNEIQLVLRDSRRSTCGITRRGVQNYADLEKELLQRLPPTCVLTGIESSEHKSRSR
jgi:hypothetical protein